MRTCLAPSALALAIMLLGAGGAHAACDGKEVLFADDFSKPDLSWSPRDLTVFRGSKYVLAIQPNGSVQDWPGAVTLTGNYSVCVQVKLPSDPAGAAGSGLIFWVDPAKNKIGAHDYHMAVVSPDGYYWVAKFADGIRTSVLDNPQGPLVNTGPNDTNELSVTLQGNSGTFSVNGKEVGKFAGQAPPRSHAGITAGAPFDKRYVVEFGNFRVLRP